MKAIKVTGYDSNPPSMCISRLLASLRKSICEFVEKEVSELPVIPLKVDIILALNFLHHLRNKFGNEKFEKTINSIFENCNEAIFEINKNEIAVILSISMKKSFIVKNIVQSHRENRIILYLTKS